MGGAGKGNGRGSPTWSCGWKKVLRMTTLWTVTRKRRGAALTSWSQTLTTGSFRNLYDTSRSVYLELVYHTTPSSHCYATRDTVQCAAGLRYVTEQEGTIQLFAAAKYPKITDLYIYSKMDVLLQQIAESYLFAQ